jgi:hypothetical protein
MPFHKFGPVARLWIFALGLSGLLAWAGQRWSAPPPIRADLVVALLLLPPLATALLVLRRWALPVEGTESVRTSEETRA